MHGDLEPEVHRSEAEDIGGSSSSAAAAATDSGWLAFLSLDYYQSFFDVTTTQVDRYSSRPLFYLPGSLIPNCSKNPLCLLCVLFVIGTGTYIGWNGAATWRQFSGQVVFESRSLWSFLAGNDSYSHCCSLQQSISTVTVSLLSISLFQLTDTALHLPETWRSGSFIFMR